MYNIGFHIDLSHELGLALIARKNLTESLINTELELGESRNSTRKIYCRPPQLVVIGTSRFTNHDGKCAIGAA